MAEVILGLGSNISPKAKHLVSALKKISEKCDIKAISNLYSSLSLLKDNQENYFNITTIVSTDLSPEQLLKFIKSIELSLGRTFTEKWKSRIIDIDILDYENIIFETPNLKIPHPEMHIRSFVLYPLNEINPKYIHPLLKKDIVTLIKEINDDLNIKKIGVLHWL